MNKKAQLGKIITTLPVLIFIILIMAVFVALSAGAFVFKGKYPPSPAGFTLTQDNLLFNMIEVKLKDSTVKKILVLDAVAKTIKDEIKKEELTNALKPLLSSQNNCAFVSVDGGIIAQTAQYKKGTFEEIKKFGNNIDSEEITRKTITLGGKEYRIEAYYGACRNE